MSLTDTQKSRIALGLSVAITLAAWQLLGSRVPARRFPTIPEFVDALVPIVLLESEFHLWYHMRFTFERIFLAFFIAMALGTALGILMGRSERFEDYVTLYILIGLSIPGVLWAFITLIWFGRTPYLVPVLATVLVLTPYLTVNVWQGTKSIDASLIQMATSFRLSDLMLWRYVIVPQLMPSIFSSMKIAFPLSWKIIIVVEIFGSSSGIGYVILNLFQGQQNDQILAWTLPFVILVYLGQMLIKRLEKRTFAWRDFSEETPQGPGA